MPKIVQPDAPKDLICSITLKIMLEPVATADGQVYERKAIEEWLKDNNTSPLTNLPLENKKLIPMPKIEAQVQEFLKKHNICTKKDFLAAVKTGNPEEVEKLNYLDKHFQSFVENTLPLNTAIKNNHTAMVEFLLKNLVNLEKIYLEYCDTEPYDDIVGYDSSDDEVWGVEEEVVAFKYSDPPLMIAASQGNLEIVALLLNKGANPNQTRFATHGSGETALLTAINSNRADIVKLLLEHGADPNQADFEDEAPPLSVAAQLGHVDIVKLLLAHEADIDAFDGYCFAMERAIHHGHADVIKAMVKKDPSVIDVIYENNETALHIAVKRCLDPTPFPTFESIFNDYNNDVDISKYLISDILSAEAFCTKTTNEATSQQAIEDFDENGSYNLPIIENDNSTKKATAEKEEKEKLRLIYLKIISILIVTGADINIKNKDGKTPMQLAIDENSTELAQFITNINRNVERESRRSASKIEKLEENNKSLQTKVEQLESQLQQLQTQMQQLLNQNNSNSSNNTTKATNTAFFK